MNPTQPGRLTGHASTLATQPHKAGGANTQSSDSVSQARDAANSEIDSWFDQGHDSLDSLTDLDDAIDRFCAAESQLSGNDDPFRASVIREDMQDRVMSNCSMALVVAAENNDLPAAIKAAKNFDAVFAELGDTLGSLQETSTSMARDAARELFIKSELWAEMPPSIKPDSAWILKAIGDGTINPDDPVQQRNVQKLVIADMSQKHEGLKNHGGDQRQLAASAMLKVMKEVESKGLTEGVTPEGAERLEQLRGALTEVAAPVRGAVKGLAAQMLRF